jgi:hypothetical protein
MEYATPEVQLHKKRKKSNWLIALIITPLVIITIHFQIYSTLKKEFHGDRSVNPAATSYFLHATAIHTVWITVLHDFLFIDYDNPLLKPFLSLRDHFFEKGESIMPADNAEDAIWWIQNYAAMYDFTVTGRDDKSMAIDTLDKPTQRAIREKIYNYIIKMDKYGIKGIHSKKFATDIPVVMTYLVIGYCRNTYYMTEGKNYQEQHNNFYGQFQTSSKLLSLYRAYDNSLKKYPFKSEDRPSEFFKHKLLGMTLWSIMYYRQYVPKALCVSPELTEYLRITDSLYRWASYPEQINDVDLQYIAKSFMKHSPNEKYELSSAVINAVSSECNSNKINTDLIKKIQGVNNGK